MNIRNQVCPLCGEKTLACQGDVVWCSNLNTVGGRSCEFGLGTGEKTFDDLNAVAMGPKAKIAELDKLIDANRAQLVLHSGFDELCAGCWQSAWDRHPELAAREQELFRQRGITQQESDIAEHKAWLGEKRAERAKHVRRRAA